MENSVWYQEEFFEDEKDYFLSKLVKLPDCFIRASSLDHMDRSLENFFYPFCDEKLRSNIGCYFFFDSYRFCGDVVGFAALYVGKTKKLNKRLYRHWNTCDNPIDKYSDDVLFQKGEYDIDLESIGKFHFGKLIPSFDIKIAIWLENDLRELMFLEHELIYKLRPMFNKA
ncbi:hypothetical protein [Shewanella mangrovisoli]|uniref:hypothetical protein n=1 Tax=Shewanella mangrovisoli TaxID=2864211 RepID=UPI0035B864B6